VSGRDSNQDLPNAGLKRKYCDNRLLCIVKMKITNFERIKTIMEINENYIQEG